MMKNKNNLNSIAYYIVDYAIPSKITIKYLYLIDFCTHFHLIFEKFADSIFSRKMILLVSESDFCVA